MCRYWCRGGLSDVVAVYDGRKPCDLFEQSAKVGIVRDADRGCDVVDGGIRLPQQLLRLLDPLTVDIFGDGASSAFAEAFVENVFGNVKCRTQMGNAQIVAEIVFDVSSGV